MTHGARRMWEGPPGDSGELGVKPAAAIAPKVSRPRGAALLADEWSSLTLGCVELHAALSTVTFNPPFGTSRSAPPGTRRRAASLRVAAR